MNKFCSRFLKAPNNYSSCIALGRSLSFKSDLSIDVLYPNSNAKLFTPAPPPVSETFLNVFLIYLKFIYYSLCSQHQTNLMDTFR